MIAIVSMLICIFSFYIRVPFLCFPKLNSYICEIYVVPDSYKGNSIDQMTGWLLKEKSDHTVIGQAKNTFRKKSFYKPPLLWPKARMNVYYGCLV